MSATRKKWFVVVCDDLRLIMRATTDVSKATMSASVLKNATTHEYQEASALQALRTARSDTGYRISDGSLADHDLI